MAGVNPIPDDYPQITPYLCVDGAGAAIEFYRSVFGASERMRIPHPSGKIGHAELQIGDSMIMLADEFPEIGIRSPKSIGGTPVTFTIYVDDADSVFARAVAGGAESLRPVQDQFYGDRAGQFLDPFGHRWSVASRIEELSAEELARRASPPAEGDSE
jgi:PhnB protein